MNADWMAGVVDPYRDGLMRQRDALQKRVEEAEADYNTYAERADTDMAGTAETVPELGDNPTDLEWLTRRAAQADRDLMAAGHAVIGQEKLLAVEKLLTGRDELDLRIGQVDHLVEAGPAAAGNDDQLAILMLDAQESAVEQRNAATAVDYARRRLALTKRMHRDIHAALRKVQRSAR